jgi:hypothetical protein
MPVRSVATFPVPAGACGVFIEPGCSRRSGQQILLFEALLHYAHLPGRILARQCERDVGRTIEPRIEFLFPRQQDGHPLVIDGRHQLVGRGGEER